MFIQLLETFITTNTTWYIGISHLRALSPGHISCRSTFLIWWQQFYQPTTSSYRESSQQVLPLLESSWRESSSNLKYFDSSLRRSSSCSNKYQVKLRRLEEPSLNTWKLSGRISVPFLRKSRINLKRTPSRSMKILPLESRRSESESFVNHSARMLSSFWTEQTINNQQFQPCNPNCFNKLLDQNILKTGGGNFVIFTGSRAEH